MSGTNQFYPVATGGSPNVLSNSAYAALSTLLAQGFTSGVVPSQQFNTMMRQATFVAAAVGQLMADITGLNINDDGVVSNFEKQLALTMCMAGFAVDTGSANAYACAFNPALPGSRQEGMVLKFKAKTANTGASTINDGISAVPIVGGAHSPLQGGEIVANGDCWIQWNGSLNSGSGAYVLLDSTGGAMQVAPPTQSQHAAQLANIGNYQGVQSVSSNITLTSASFGQIYEAATGDPGGRLITFPAAAGNGSKVIVLINSSSGNWTLNAGNINCAYGSGASVIMPPSSTGVFMSDNTSFNAIGGSAAFGIGPRPQSGAGVGQWTSPSLTGSGASTYWTLPSGGAWAYFVSNAGSHSCGVAAGGSNVMGPFTAGNSIGFCWRIA